jgi:hypothetical protein
MRDLRVAIDLKEGFMDYKVPRQIVHGALGAVLLVLLGGCSTLGNEKDAPIEPLVANARTSADHEKVALWYEQEAAMALEQSRRHERMLQDIYRPAYDRSFAGYREAGFLRHCEQLMGAYRQAADESLALAKLHRELADGASE